MTRPRSKATNNDGSIWSRKNAQGRLTWYVEISDGYYPNGKRKRIRRAAPTQAAARKLRHELLHQQHQGLLTPQRLDTVRSFGTSWVTEIKPLNVRASTASDYHDRLLRYVFPHLGSVRMVELTPRHVTTWLRALSDQGFSANTINGARRILFQLCKYATRVGLTPYNPVQATDPISKPRHLSQVRPPWSLEEVTTVLTSAVDQDHLDCFLHLMLHTGIRPGEALGLRWEDIDETMDRIHITGTLKSERRITSNEHGVVRLTRNDPKTESSHRYLDSDEGINAALNRQKALQHRWKEEGGQSWVNSGYVITSMVGTPVSSSNLRKRYQRFLDEIGVRYIRLHDLRHTVARVALEAGIPLEHVSQVLGHTRIDTTKQIYAGHVPRFTKNFADTYSECLPSPPSNVPDTVEELQQIWAPST